MFCPKCGTQNPETGRFCRQCGADLGNVSAALAGKLPASPASGAAHLGHKSRRRQDPNELMGEAIKQIMTGIGFFVVAIVLFTTGVAGGHAWWWAMLFPAFGCLGKGISDYAKSKGLANRQLSSHEAAAGLAQSSAAGALAAHGPADEQIRRLLGEGHKIEAIKVYRESTGADLKTAKEEIERLERERVPVDYMAPPQQSIYDTGELTAAPPSITEETTRHLELDSEGKTMTLPKK